MIYTYILRLICGRFGDTSEQARYFERLPGPFPPPKKMVVSEIGQKERDYRLLEFSGERRERDNGAFQSTQRI